MAPAEPGLLGGKDQGPIAWSRETRMIGGEGSGVENLGKRLHLTCRSGSPVCSSAPWDLSPVCGFFGESAVTELGLGSTDIKA